MDLAVEADRRDRKLRILVTRLRFLGDVIISTPVIHELKKRYPEGFTIEDARREGKRIDWNEEKKKEE